MENSLYIFYFLNYTICLSWRGQELSNPLNFYLFVIMQDMHS